MLINLTKSSILTLTIYIIFTTIPLDIFSEVKNSNYNGNDLIYEITDKQFNRLIVIGPQEGAMGLV